MPLLDFAQRQKVSKGFRQPIMFVVNIGLVLAVLSLGSTLASNIRINSGALEFKLISAARVDLIARTPAITPIAITTFTPFLPPFGARLEDSKSRKDMG